MVGAIDAFPSPRTVFFFLTFAGAEVEQKFWEWSPESAARIKH